MDRAAASCEQRNPELARTLANIASLRADQFNHLPPNALEPLKQRLTVLAKTTGPFRLGEQPVSLFESDWLAISQGGKIVMGEQVLAEDNPKLGLRIRLWDPVEDPGTGQCAYRLRAVFRTAPGNPTGVAGDMTPYSRQLKPGALTSIVCFQPESGDLVKYPGNGISFTPAFVAKIGRIPAPVKT